MSPREEGRIRVLQVITRLVRRGASRHVVDLAGRLDRRRFDVELLAGRGEEDEGSLWAAAEATGLRCHRVDSLQRRVSLPADLRAFRAILAILRTGRFDIVHTHISKSGILGRLAARVAGVPVVVHTYHGTVAEVMGPGAMARVLRLCERVCSGVTNGHIAISRQVAGQIEAAGIATADCCTVIENGIDLEIYRPEASPHKLAALRGGRAIGAVGSLTEEKGMADLLRAAVPLCAAHPDLTVCVVGDGPLRSGLMALTRELGLEGRVLFAGVVEDVRPWMQAFEMLVLPSHSEGMPLTLVEAMALGCPIVATDVGGVAEVVGTAARLVPAGEPDRLAAEVAALLADAGSRQELARLGRVRAEGFSLERMVDRTADVYERLLQAARAA